MIVRTNIEETMIVQIKREETMIVRTNSENATISFSTLHFKGLAILMYKITCIRVTKNTVCSIYFIIPISKFILFFLQ